MRFHSKTLLALFVSIVLAAGVISPAGASSFTQVGKPPTDSTPVSELPPLAVRPGKPYAPPSIRKKDTGAPAVDLVAPIPAPANDLMVPATKDKFDPLLSVPISRSEYETLYRNPDGSKTRLVSPVPVNFQKSDGSWTTVQTAVLADPATGGFRVENNPLKPTFAATTATGADLVTSRRVV